MTINDKHKRSITKYIIYGLHLSELKNKPKNEFLKGYKADTPLKEKVMW